MVLCSCPSTVELTANNSDTLTLSISNFKHSDFWEPTWVTKLGLWQISGGEKDVSQENSLRLLTLWIGEVRAKLKAGRRAAVRGEKIWVSERFPGGGRRRDQTSTKNKTLLWCLQGELWVLSRSRSGAMSLVSSVNWLRKIDDTVPFFFLFFEKPGVTKSHVQYLLNNKNIIPLTPYPYLAPRDKFMSHKKKKKWLKVLKLSVVTQSSLLNVIFRLSYIFIFLFLDNYKIWELLVSHEMTWQ